MDYPLMGYRVISLMRKRPSLKGPEGPKGLYDPLVDVCLQEYLAHQKMPNPLGPPRTPGIGYGRVLGGCVVL